MSSMPECKICGVYVHRGYCICEECGTPKHKTFNDWFLSLPEECQDQLQQDPARWAEAAFEAGRS